MKNLTIYYKANEEGRKASILNGGNGRELQKVSMLLTPELLKIAKVDISGKVTLEVGFESFGGAKIDAVHGHSKATKHEIRFKRLTTRFERMMNPDELIAFEKARVASLQMKIQELEKTKDEYMATIMAAQEEKLRKKEMKEKQKQKETNTGRKSNFKKIACVLKRVLNLTSEKTL